jgi:hypothetical protein
MASFKARGNHRTHQQKCTQTTLSLISGETGHITHLFLGKRRSQDDFGEKFHCLIEVIVEHCRRIHHCLAVACAREIAAQVLCVCVCVCVCVSECVSV